MTAARSRRVAVTFDWPKTNRLRGQLIEREALGLLNVKDADELEQLQQLADLRTDFLDPFNMDDLEQVHTAEFSPLKAVPVRKQGENR